ncbi:PREDICTED: solute carrier family 43 member 3 isoform X1 [Thamnophis sirtalis]|uniref:Solute carrier family 43 member 3 isoform X1 n=2 Tax=Thamnophis sirtalis TaxID=35019 RepID=A0A6I9YLP8_9SAUR|nr:PREDICTED: solute carrier family 43 member 3 isoform X1 [Thamnophis sirtalis]
MENKTHPGAEETRLEKTEKRKESAPEAMESQKARTAKRLATFITGLVECMCFAGVIFGWTSLVYVLKQLKYFDNFCESAVNATTNRTIQGCAAQDEQFSLIFTIGSFMNNFMTFPTGYIFDHFGTTVARLIAISSYTMGSLLIAFSSAATAIMLYPAMTFISVGGILLILTNMQVGNLFGKHRSTIITLYNGAFDSSSAIFLIIKLLYEQGLSLGAMFFFMSACSAWHLVRTFFLMPRYHIPYPLPPGYTYGLKCPGISHSYHTYEEQGSPKITVADEAQDSNNLHDESALKGEQATIKDKGDTDTGADAKQPPVKSFRKCIFSMLFFWHLVWLSVMQLRHYLFIGTLNPMLRKLANEDNSLVSSYTNAFAFTQLCGVLCAPWNGLILDWHKHRQKKGEGAPDPVADLRSCILSLTITVLQCLAFSICASIPVLPVQYATFILQVLSRSFLYGGNAAFLAIAFPPEHFGKLYGLVMGLSAVVSLLQYPCFILIKGPLKGDSFYVNIAFIVLMLLAFVNPFTVWRECKRRQKEQAARKPGLETSL